ncbi:MAG: hypothetical protein HMLKMBBP_00144 [Planctomycetes bacterium]|nr:hypothetical protein [Planctomycetota bacterium]
MAVRAAALLAAAALALLSPPALSAADRDAERAAHVAALTAGVRKVAKPGVPGPVACFGEDAFPVVAGDMGDGRSAAVVGAATPGRGRVVAFGHGGFLSKDGLAAGDTARLVVQSVRWAAGKREKPVVAVCGADALLPRLDGLDARKTDGSLLAAALQGAHVVVYGDEEGLDAEEAKLLDRFVRDGGGLVTSGLAWGWMQIHDDLDLTRDHTLNEVLAPMGLAFVDGYVDAVPELPAARDGDAIHTLCALERVELSASSRAVDARTPGKAAEHLARMKNDVQLVSAAYRWLPVGATAFRDRVRAVVAKAGADLVPTEKAPIRAGAALKRLAVLVRHMDDLAAEPRHAKLAASASDFPGVPPPGTPRTARTVRIDPTVPGWTSTGLWALAGEVVTADVAADAPANLGLRIGCHTDTLWHLDDWRRHPEISRRFALPPGRTEAANPHGGLVYVDVPRDLADPKPFDVRIAGAVIDSPRFVLGETDAAAWKKAVAGPCAPWVELSAKHVTLTVRTEDARTVADPVALMTFWRDVIPHYADLGQRAEDAAGQRFVPDRQISAGWLHSGYPIMAHLVHSRELLRWDVLRPGDPREHGGWGFWHEMGHNHQQDAWTFDGTTEVTCNLFSLFVEEKIRGIRPKDHPWPAGSHAKAKAHLAGDRDFGAWKRDPGLALWMYIALEDAFGWDAFRGAFRTYVGDAKLPRGDDAQRDQWLVRMSRACRRDLGPFFEAWGVPVSAAARAEAAKIPEWKGPFLPEPSAK